MLTQPLAISNFEILLNRNFSENYGKLDITGSTHEAIFREAHGYPDHNYTPKNTPSKRTFRDVVARDRLGRIESITELKCQGAKPSKVKPGAQFQIVLTRRSAGIGKDVKAEEAMKIIMDDLHEELREVMDECHGNFGVSTMIYSNEKVSVWNESGQHLINHLSRDLRAHWVEKDIGDRTTHNLWITDADTGKRIISYTSHSKTELVCHIPDDHMEFMLKNEGRFGFLPDHMVDRIDRALADKKMTREQHRILLSDLSDIFREY